jgi:hypothetical protein
VEKASVEHLRNQEVRMYVCVCTHMYMHKHIPGGMYVCLCTHVYIYKHIHMQWCSQEVCMYVSVCTHKYVYTHIHMQRRHAHAAA